MSTRMSGLWLAPLAMLALCSPALADSQPSVQGTGPILIGQSPYGKGSTATITLPNGTVIKGVTVNEQGKFRKELPIGTKGKVTTIYMKGTETSEPVEDEVSSLNPPGVITTTTAVVTAGSRATIGGSVLALSGRFTTLDTGVDYNPASPTYGKVSGRIVASAFDLTGAGPAGTLTLSLPGDSTYTQDLSAVWALADRDGASASIGDAAIAGTATFDGASAPFSGSVSGQETFFDDGTDDISFTFDLSTSFGPVEGSVDATGVETLNVAEPSTAALLSALLWTAAALRTGRRRKVRADAAGATVA